jgi:hypothetical protein
MGEWASKVTEPAQYSSASTAPTDDSLMSMPEDGEIYGPPAPTGPVDMNALVCQQGMYAEEFPSPNIEGQGMKLGDPEPKPKKKPKKKKPPAKKKTPFETTMDQVQKDTARDVDEMNKRPLPSTPEEQDKYFMPPELYDATRGKSPEERAHILQEHEQRQMMGDEDWNAVKGMDQAGRQKFFKDKERRMTQEMADSSGVVLPPEPTPPMPPRNPASTPRGQSPPPR